jgi:hypothetical protein
LFRGQTDDLTGPKNFVPFYISRPRNTDPNNPAYQLPGQSTPLLTQGPPSPQRPPPERSSLDVSDITRVKLAPPPPLKSTARAPRPATARPCAASHSEDIVGAQPTAPRNFTHDPLDVSDITGNAVQRSSRPVSAAPRPTSTAACDDIAGASVRPRFDLSKVWAHPDFKYTEGSKAKSTVGSRRDHQDSSLRSGACQSVVCHVYRVVGGFAVSYMGAASHLHRVLRETLRPTSGSFAERMCAVRCEREEKQKVLVDGLLSAVVYMCVCVCVCVSQRMCWAPLRSTRQCRSLAS